MIRFFRGRRERDLDEEIRAHVEMAVHERIARGESRRDAERAVRREFGDVDRVKEATREAWGWLWIERLCQDVRYALRALRKNPGFAASALTILALGIGANTALFSLVKEVFLQAPPVAHAERLVTLYTTCRRGQPRCSSSYQDYLDYRDRTTALEDLAGVDSMSVSLGEDGRAPTLAGAMLVSGNYFEVVGLAPRLGRLIQPADDRVGAPAEVAVLSSTAWRTRFGAAPDIVGRTVLVNGSALEIIGVTPDGFRGTSLTDDADLFIPVTAASRLETPPAVGEQSRRIAESDYMLFERRNVRWMERLVGRLAPGATPARAREELRAVSEALRAEDPDARGPRSITLDSAAHYTLPEQEHDELGRFVFLIAVVVGLILALACANVANLLLARGAARLKEIAMRRTLGANRRRVVGQLVTESLVLGFLGGAAGVVLAPVLMRALSRATLPGGVELGRLGLNLDWSTLAFGLLLAAATSVVFGLVPALRAARVGLLSVVKGEGDHRSAGGARLRKTLIAVQTGLCLLLLVGSGLFVQTVRNGLAHDAGFDPERLALLQFDLQPLGLPGAATLEGLERVQTRSAAIPGVRSAAVVTQAPLMPGGQGIFFEVPDYVPAPDEELRLEWIGASPGVLATLGIRLDSGRDLSDESDRRVWINETMARRYFPDGAVGRRVRMLSQVWTFGPVDGELTVAGVFADVDWSRIGEQTINNVIVPLEAVVERTVSGPVTLAARFDGVEPPLSGLRDAVRGVFPEVTFLDARTADTVVQSQLAPQRLVASLLSGIGALALVLAALGIAGVVTHLVGQRRRDIGIQMALGASPGRVVGALVREMAGPILSGALLGAVASIVLGRAAEAFLFGVAPGDPETLAAGLLTLSSIALLAVVLPARRASTIEPMRVLRDG